MRYYTLLSVFVAIGVGFGCSSSTDSSGPTASDSDGGPGVGSDGGTPGADATTGDGAATSDAGSDASPAAPAPTFAYVMTTFHMFKLKLSDPGGAPEELSFAVGTGSYGRAGASEPFDVSPDGTQIALLFNGYLHIAPIANLAGEVTVAADAWAAAPRFTDDGQHVRWVRRSRSGGGRFDTVEIVEVPLTGGTPSVVKSLPSPDFYTDLDKYTWKWDGSAIIGPARLEGKPDNTTKAHGFVSIDVASGAPTLHTKAYAGKYFTMAQNVNEPTCTGDLCVTVHDGTTGGNNGSFEPDSFHFLPSGGVYFTSNRDQYVQAGASKGQRVYLADTLAGGDYEKLVAHTGERPAGYSRDGAFYAVFDVGPNKVRVVRSADNSVVATFATQFNLANVPMAIRFAP